MFFEKLFISVLQEIQIDCYRLLQTLENLKYEVALIKAGFNPAQPRVPAGSPDGGEWTGGGGGGGGENAPTLPHRKPRTPDFERPIHDPPIRRVYPVETALTFWFGGEAVAIARGAIATARGLTGAAGRMGAAEEGAAAAETGLTSHGSQRIGERVITQKDIEEAIRTAKETGNITTKLGKYRTLQNVYKGSNGVTVHIETQGRNAGKVITTYGAKPGGKL